MKKAGIQAGYHNHHMEFEKLDGQFIYDALLKQLDPNYVKMQFQVAVISFGYKASDYFNKFPGDGLFQLTWLTGTLQRKRMWRSAKESSIGRNFLLPPIPVE